MIKRISRLAIFHNSFHCTWNSTSGNYLINIIIKFNNITTVKNCITFKQSLLKINTNPDKSLITVENIGTSPIKNIIFRYAIPTRYEVNLGSLSAIFNNNDKWNLIAEKIDSNIIFKISFLPQSNNIPERKLNIFLEHKKINIQLSNVDSSLSINDK